MSSKRRSTSSSTGSPRAENDAVQVAPPPAAEQARTSPAQPLETDRVGDILRRVREHRGEDLDVISEYLRIRPAYLYALENSRYDKLPADAYVIGFLRSYANYLGLDGRGAIDQYRREMAGRRRKPQLSMPQPISEGRGPTLAVLAGAAVAALLIYGLWYGLSTPDKDVMEQPVPLPETMLEKTATPPAGTVADTATGSIFLQTATMPEAVELPVETAKPAAKTATEALPALATTTATTNATTSTKTEPKTEDKTPPAAPQTEDSAVEQPKAAVFGDKSGTRVTIRADKESWVLITDKRGVTLFDRTLKAGESYNVPTGKDLNLTTGNVSGVVLSVDGKDMPKLPANGRVARNIPLEPEALAARLTGKKAPSAPAESQIPTTSDGAEEDGD